MTQSLPRKLFSDRTKLSGQLFALSLFLLIPAFAPGNAGNAQAKDVIEKNSASQSSATHPGGHACIPPGPPPFGFMDGLPGPPPPPMALPLAFVDLSDEQVEKLAQLHTAFMEQTGPVIFKLHSLESQFRIALGASSLNTEELNSLRSKIAAQRVLVDAALVDYAIAQAQALTSEQRHEVKLHMERFELNHGFGPHPGPHE